MLMSEKKLKSANNISPVDDHVKCSLRTRLFWRKRRVWQWPQKCKNSLILLFTHRGETCMYSSQVTVVKHCLRPTSIWHSAGPRGPGLVKPTSAVARISNLWTPLRRQPSLLPLMTPSSATTTQTQSSLWTVMPSPCSTESATTGGADKVDFI